MQYFKGDDLEHKMYESARGILDNLSLSKDVFYQGAYDCDVLGDIIHESRLSPLANAIVINIFRETFNELFQSFTFAGTFESYLSVFIKVFGPSVVVTFTVPAPGKLVIDIDATEINISNFVARYVEDNTFKYNNVVTLTDLDQIVFRTVKGFDTQYELEQMLFEMVPAGIFTDINLTII